MTPVSIYKLKIILERRPAVADKTISYFSSVLKKELESPGRFAEGTVIVKYISRLQIKTGRGQNCIHVA